LSDDLQRKDIIAPELYFQINAALFGRSYDAGLVLSLGAAFFRAACFRLRRLSRKVFAKRSSRLKDLSEGLFFEESLIVMPYSLQKRPASPAL